ncbi:MAG: glutathione synthase [Desulfuromonadales bacterium]|nr:glutathione synthase [Desulfuromonadales bacterium]
MPTPVSLFVIDPPERLDPPTDTSLALMRASLGRGHRVGYCTLADLRLQDERPWGRVRPIRFVAGEELFRAGAAQDLDLSELAVVYMRKDPPVDAAYLQACAILDRLPPWVLQVNPARALKLHGEKFIPLYFPGLMPETLISAAPADLLAFVDRIGKAVIKPLDECSGRGVFVLERHDPQGEQKLAEATVAGSTFMQAQRFLPEIVEGDKRVLLLGGEILGWVRRVPPAGSFRSNVNAGGCCVPCELTDVDRSIAARLRPWLVAEEIHLAGVDIVGDKVLEVNITSPSCLREINQLTGAALEERILDYVVSRCRPPQGTE